MRADVIVCSPPYAENDCRGGDTPAARGVGRNTRGQRPCEAEGRHNLTRDYGSTIGQLGAMRPGDTPEGSMIDTIEAIQWDGCYDDNWKGIISEASFSHPAKMSRGLVARIFDHLFATGRIRRGSLVVDPFGGIGTTAIEGASRGCKVVCVELESKFYRLMNGHDCPGSKGDLADLCPDCQKQHAEAWKDGGCAAHHFVGNFDLHRKTWEAFGDPLPVAVNGDSRNLVALLGPVLAECVVSSPPFQESGTGGVSYEGSQTVRKNSDREWVKKWENGAREKGDTNYGTSPGQLGALAAGSVEAVLSREADCVVSSPPYEGSNQDYSESENCRKRLEEKGVTRKESAMLRAKNSCTEGYGESDGQLAGEQGDTFWQAARVIIEQSFAILRPGGCAAWVVKAFVRNKAIVDFPGDWRRLCEACGFQTVEVIHASLVKRTAEASLFGGEEVKEVARKSFFRRLAESKGSPRIDHEVVLIMVKPAGDGNGADVVVSSPPWENQEPSHAQGDTRRFGTGGQTYLQSEYGSTAGQLGSMPPGRIEDAL